MPTLDALNGSGEARLTDLKAQTWVRMKNVGATARWEAPVSGQLDVPFAGGGDGGPMRAAPRESFDFEFLVRFQGNELVREAQRFSDSHVTATLFRATTMP